MSGSYLLVLMTIFVVGSYIGRWLYRAAQRFPKHYTLREQLTSLLTEGDCRSCGTRETGLQHLPVIGCLVAGRCQNCGRKMDARRPWVEFITGLLLAALYLVEIPDFGEFVIQNSRLWTPEAPPGPEAVTQLWSLGVWLHLRYLLHAVMLCGLIVATVIDFELCIIPDGCTIPAMIFAVVCSFVVGQSYIVPIWFQDESTARTLSYVLPEALQWLVFNWDASAFANAHPHWHGLLVSLTGLIMGAAVTWSIRAIGFLVLKMEAMGDGDVVLMALIGAAIGWQPVLVVFFLAPLPAIAAAGVLWFLRRNDGGLHYFPYGPWLSLATVIVLLAWQAVWPLVSPVFDMGLVLFLLGFVMLVGMAALLQLVQIIKQMLGIEPPDFDESPGWSSADHLCYYASERPDEQTGLWPQDQWPGARAGRGQLHQHDWRRGR